MAAAELLDQLAGGDPRAVDALWDLGTPEAHAAVRGALTAAGERVRLAAIRRLLAQGPDADAHAAAAALIADDTATQEARSGAAHELRTQAEPALDDALLVGMNATVIHAPQEDQWAPGYYSVLFEDPDGIRLEMNHVPGKGLLAD